MGVRTEELKALGITAFELTVDDLRAWLADCEQFVEDEIDVFELLLAGEGPTLSELCRMCSASPEDLGALGQGDVDQIEAAARKLNPRFFTMKPRLARLMEPVYDAAIRRRLYLSMLPASSSEDAAEETEPTPGSPSTPSSSTTSGSSSSAPTPPLQAVDGTTALAISTGS